MLTETMTKRRSANASSSDGQVSESQTEAWHVLSVAEAFQRQQTDVAQGLTQAEAARRLTQYGPNALAQARQRSTLSIFVAQFQSLIVALLVAATVIALAMGDNIEAVAILVVIVINAAISFFTEWKAQRALSALQKQAVRLAHVIREGVESEIPAAELVPGDLIVLAAGARVPADGRVVECVRLQIEEAALTGESHAVTKIADPLPDKDAALGDRLNMAFLGTTITDGRGRLLVTATGVQTEVGKIGVLIDEATTRATPLEQKLAQLSRLLIVIVLVLCAIIVAAGWLRGVSDFWHMLEIGVSLAIAAVPEGLPAVATMTLALGMQRMARMRALVRRLPAVETLGSTTVICTDKTGTLTKNEMTACVFMLDRRRIEVTGTGYAPVGTFQDGDKPVDPRADEHLALALRIGMLCNDAKVEHADGVETVLGDPTEAALIVAAEKAGMKAAALAPEFPRLSEVPFDSTSKRMVTVHRGPQGPTLAFVKGAPSTMIASSNSQFRVTGVTPLTDDDRRHWEATNEELVGIRDCVTQLEAGRVEATNCYGRSVRRTGNADAQRVIEQAYAIGDGPWRGFGIVPRGDLRLRPELQRFDATQRFGVIESRLCLFNECRVPDVLSGRNKPPECRHFGTSCVPETRLGAPMVSSEGACAAYYRYAARGKE